MALRMWNWKFGNENLGLKKTWKLWIWIFIFNPFQKKFHHFFFFWGWLSQLNLTELTQLLVEFKCGGWNFGPPLLCFSLFSFFASPSSTFLPPLTLFIFFFPMIFLLHFTISSHKKHFSKLFNFPSSISINNSLDPCVFEHFHHTPIFGETYFSFASRWLLPPKDPIFLLFMVRNMISHLIGMIRMGFFKTLGPMLHIAM